MRKEEVDREELINEIWKARGNVTRAAAALGIWDKTIYNYADKYATVKEAIALARQHNSNRLVDIAELALEKQLSEGRAWAVKYTLTTQGSERGWGERIQQDIHLDDGLIVNIGPAPRES